MRADTLMVASLTLFGSVAGVGCDDCPRRLETRVSYTGAQAGTFYYREFSPDGVVAFSSGRIDMGMQGNATGDACWEAAAATDSPGYRLEAWVDLDGDDEQPCRDDFMQTTCGPDAGEPQAQMEFTVKAKGTTTVIVTFSDPTTALDDSPRSDTEALTPDSRRPRPPTCRGT
jgi:hypothetical protein